MKLNLVIALLTLFIGFMSTSSLPTSIAYGQESAEEDYEVSTSTQEVEESQESEEEASSTSSWDDE